jgi:hypothetical protein
LIAREAGIPESQIPTINFRGKSGELYTKWQAALQNHHKENETPQQVVARIETSAADAAAAKAIADAAAAKAAADAAAAKAAEDAKVPASIRGTEYDPRNLAKLSQQERYDLAVKGLFALDELKSERSTPNLERIHDKMDETVRWTNKHLGTTYARPAEADPLSVETLTALGQRVAAAGGIRTADTSIYKTRGVHQFFLKVDDLLFGHLHLRFAIIALGKHDIRFRSSCWRCSGCRSRSGRRCCTRCCSGRIGGIAYRFNTRASAYSWLGRSSSSRGRGCHGECRAIAFACQIRRRGGNGFFRAIEHTVAADTKRFRATYIIVTWWYLRFAIMRHLFGKAQRFFARGAAALVRGHHRIHKLLPDRILLLALALTTVALAINGPAKIVRRAIVTLCTCEPILAVRFTSLYIVLFDSIIIIKVRNPYNETTKVI